MRERTIRLLPSALGVALLAVAMLAAPVLAQETTGNIAGFVTADKDGTALPGVTVTVKSSEGGVERTTITDTEGSYRFNLLPIGKYTLTAALEGYHTLKQEHVTVNVGRTTQVAVALPTGTVEEAITVTSEAPLIDVSSTVSGVNVSMDELADRVPVAREVTQVALLAPGTAPGDTAFNSDLRAYTPGQQLTSIGGGSVAENNYIINGLNVSNFRNGVGGSNVPFEFVKEVQVKTGGYEAEFGRSTGGVLNMVSRSGSNAFHGGVNGYYNPESLQEQSPDYYDGLNSLENNKKLEANASLGGPIWKDRAFFFGFYQYNDVDWSRVDIGEETLFHYDDPFYGGKVDINLTKSHRLEGTYFTDAVTVDSNSYNHDPVLRQRQDFKGAGTHSAGGENKIGRYTGIFGSHVVLSGQYGENDFDRTILSSGDAFSSVVDSRAGGLQYIGNAVNLQFSQAFDSREASRIDLDGFVGNHSLRAGADDELNSSFDQTSYSGGDYYRYFLNGTRFPQLSPTTQVARYRIFLGGGDFDTVSNAYYVQDGWEITPKVLFNFGIRNETYDNKNALGQSFIKKTDQWAPRLGAVWDMGGDGRSKLFASAGRYHLYIASNTNIRQAAAEFFTEDWFVLLPGCNLPSPTKSTCLGTQLQANVFSDGTVHDVKETRSNNVDPMYQDEYRVGYERMVGGKWSVGLSSVYRDLGQTIEDITLQEALAIPIGQTVEYRLTNPGSYFTGWIDDGTGNFVPVAFDQQTAGQYGFPDPKRKYYGADLTFRRRYADNWMLQGNYTWSHGYGNYEGYVRSDNGQDDAGITTLWDYTGLVHGAYGNLPNDRRHNVHVFGAYQFPIGLWVGASAAWREGRPINSFGVNTDDAYAATYGNESFYRQAVFLPRGTFGTTDAITNFDMTVKYDLKLSERVDLTFRVDGFNVFNWDTATEVNESGDESSGAIGLNFLKDSSFQQPRQIRFSAGVRF